MSRPQPTALPRTRPQPAGRAATIVVLAAALIGVPAARAGGDFVDLAVAAGRVWFVGPPGVRSLDPRTGRTLFGGAVRRQPWSGSDSGTQLFEVPNC